MRLEATPDRQQTHNDGVHRHLRTVAALAIILIASAVGLEATLYFYLKPPVGGPLIVGSDGSTTLGSAVILTPDSALTTVEIPAGAELQLAGRTHITLRKINTVTVLGAPFVLLHLDVPYPKQIPSMRALQNGEEAVAVSFSGKWDGTLTETTPTGAFAAQPQVAIGDTAALVAKSDGAIVGIVAPTGEGDTAIPIMAILAAFPELKK